MRSAQPIPFYLLKEHTKPQLRRIGKHLYPVLCSSTLENRNNSISSKDTKRNGCKRTSQGDIRLPRTPSAFFIGAGVRHKKINLTQHLSMKKTASKNQLQMEDCLPKRSRCHCPCSGQWVFVEMAQPDPTLPRSSTASLSLMTPLVPT